MLITSTDHVICGNLEILLEILKILWNLVAGYLSLAVSPLFVSAEFC